MAKKPFVFHGPTPRIIFHNYTYVSGVFRPFWFCDNILYAFSIPSGTTSYFILLEFFSRTSSTYPIVGVAGYCFNWLHSDTHNQLDFLDQWSASRRDLYLTTLTRDKLQCPLQDSTPKPSKRAAADPRLWPHGHQDRPAWLYEPNYNTVNCKLWTYRYIQLFTSGELFYRCFKLDHWFPITCENELTNWTTFIFL
jgi:hypothetical protein